MNDVGSESPDRVSDRASTPQETACASLPYDNDLDRPLEDCIHRTHLARDEDSPRRIGLRGINVRDE